VHREQFVVGEAEGPRGRLGHLRGHRPASWPAPRTGTESTPGSRVTLPPDLGNIHASLVVLGVGSSGARAVPSVSGSIDPRKDPFER
jgi:hypothetical protein